MGHVDVKVVFGILGNITSLLLFSSPIPTFIKIVKQRSVGDYSGIPYVATLLNCFLWVLYGLPVVKFQVLVVASIQLIMVTKAFLVVVIAFIAMTTLVLKLVASHDKRKDVIGSLCVVFAVIMYASPLTVMRMVIRTRSVKYMPFLLSVFMFINGTVWFVYAFLGGIDIYIIIPNGLGVVAATAQLSLYAYYKNATPRDDIDENGNPKKPNPIPL